MTKKRKIEILKDLLIQLSDSANILCTCEADERCEVVEEYIEELEQQPCDEDLKMSNCTDCEEYNQEKYYCPKFCDVIRDTTKEMQKFYKGEHEKLERIEQIVEEWNNDTEKDIESLDTMDRIRDVLNG